MFRILKSVKKNVIKIKMKKKKKQTNMHMSILQIKIKKLGLNNGYELSYFFYYIPI